MSSIESNIEVLSKPIKEVFEFLSVPANYEFLMPG